MNVNEAKEKLDKANAMLDRLCKGERFVMRIPAQPNQDSDIVIGDGLQAGKEAIEEVEELRAARKEDQTLINDLQAKFRAISELISSRHGDDGRFCEPEDEYNDDPEVITLKRIFAIIEDVTISSGEIHGPGGYYDAGAR